MNIKLDNGSYQLNLNAGDVIGKDKEEVKEFAGTVLCHLLLEMLTRYADDEDEAKGMMVDILEDMVGTLGEFFEQGVFDEFHRLQVEETNSMTDAEVEKLFLFMERDFEEWVKADNIDVEEYKKRYIACEQLDLVICKDNTGDVAVTLTDGINRDTMFHYSKEQMEGEDFDKYATRDLMHLHVLGDRLSGDVQNPLRKILPKNYVERCIKAAC